MRDPLAEEMRRRRRMIYGIGAVLLLVPVLFIIASRGAAGAGARDIGIIAAVVALALLVYLVRFVSRLVRLSPERTLGKRGWLSALGGFVAVLGAAIAWLDIVDKGDAAVGTIIACPLLSIAGFWLGLLAVSYGRRGKARLAAGAGVLLVAASAVMVIPYFIVLFTQLAG